MSKRKRRLAGEIGSFLKQYQRKAYPTSDPNDRHYSRKVETLVKNMPVEVLDELMNGLVDEGISEAEDLAWQQGCGIPGVRYAKNDIVKLSDADEEFGIVVDLVRLTPEPVYLVELNGKSAILVSEGKIVLI